MTELGTIVVVIGSIIIVALGAILFLFDWTNSSVNKYSEKDGTKIQK